jgi:hypothetical protein
MRTRVIALPLAALALISSVGNAQVAASSPMPRVPTDTTYGIMLGLEQFARSIRRGELDIRSYRSPELAAALNDLKVAAQTRKFRGHDPSLGPLADFRFDSVEVDRTSKSKETVIVKARAILASDRGGARRVVLHFREVTGRWVPVQLDGFLEYLEAQSKRYATKEAQ